MGEIWPKECEQGRGRRDHLLLLQVGPLLLLLLVVLRPSTQHIPSSVSLDGGQRHSYVHEHACTLASLGSEPCG